MRRFRLLGQISLAVVVAASIPAWASDECGAAVGTWLKVLGGEHEIATTSVTRSGSCGFLTASFVAGGTTDLLLSKVDAGGSGWTRQYASDRPRWRTYSPLLSKSSDPEVRFSWVSAAPIDDSETAVVLDNVLLTLDGNGQPRWARQYGEAAETGPDYLRTFRFTSVVRVERGFIVLAHKHRGRADDGSSALLRIADDGSVVWARHYPDMRTELNAPLIKTPDGRLLVGGDMRVDARGRYNPKGGFTRAVVARLNMDGTVDWVRAVEMSKTPSGRSRHFQTIGLAGNGDIILVHGVSQAVFTRLTPEGEHVWSRQFDWNRATHATSTKIKQVVADGDDLLVVGSSGGFQLPAHGYQINYNAFLARLGSDGAPVWIRSYGKTSALMQHDASFDADYGTGLLLTPDRHLVMTGYTDTFSNAPRPEYHYDALLALTDIEGFVQRGGNLVTTPDVGNPTEVWSKAVHADLASPELLPVTLDPISELVTYTASDATLLERELPSESSEFELTYDASKRELVSNMSMFHIDDAANDPDGDGLRQDWENEAIRLLNPVVQLDEEEDWLNYTHAHHVANLVRVSPWPRDELSPNPPRPRYVILYLAMTWAADYGSGLTQNPYTSAEDHRGDIERVVIALRLISDRRAKIEWVTTSAHGSANDHEGVWHVKDKTCNEAKIKVFMGNDPGHEVMCDTLRFNRDGLIVLQASEDKHALYPSARTCNAVTLVRVGIADAWGENCGWDSSPIAGPPVDPTVEEDPRYLGDGLWRFEAYNVGEPDYTHRLVDDLNAPDEWIGLTDAQKETLVGKFPDEVVWSGGNRFCGGLRRVTASTTIQFGLFLPDKCVDDLPGNKLTMPDALPAKLESYYRVSITTARSAGSGSDAAVFIRLINGDRHTSVRAVGSFEKGDTDIIHMGSSDIGTVKEIRLGHNNYGDDPNWRIVKIVVERNGTSDRWVWSSADGVVVNAESVMLALTPQ